ncbi:MAG: hypothetical protein M1823_004357 [Watsoniomyces obsoletus]|nr:MAG: hypothetical protein M1823_004357 [Watsoniomyces obsoletus]
MSSILMARDGGIKPAMEPPPGIVSNFDNPESRKELVVIAAIVCPIISGLFLTLRLYTRTFITRTLGWDDYTCMAAMLFAIGFSFSEWQLAEHGLGTHQWDLPWGVYHRPFLKIRLTGFALYWAQMCAIKLSILFLYSRLFTVSFHFRIMTWITGAVVVAYSSAGLIGTLAVCKPAVAICGNITNMAVVSSALNILTDVIIFCLPLPQVYRLQVTIRQRIGLALIFATGFFVCVVSVVRLHYYVIGIGVKDVSWFALNGEFWTLMEGNTAIVCACMPALRAFIHFHGERSRFADRAATTLHLNKHRKNNNTSHDHLPLGSSPQLPAGARHTITVTTTVSNSTKPLDATTRDSVPAVTTNTRGGGSIGTRESYDGFDSKESFKHAGAMELGYREEEKGVTAITTEEAESLVVMDACSG